MENEGATFEQQSPGASEPPQPPPRDLNPFGEPTLPPPPPPPVLPMENSDGVDLGGGATVDPPRPNSPPPPLPENDPVAPQPAAAPAIPEREWSSLPVSDDVAPPPPQSPPPPIPEVPPSDEQAPAAGGSIGSAAGTVANATGGAARPSMLSASSGLTGRRQGTNKFLY